MFSTTNYKSREQCVLIALCLMFLSSFMSEVAAQSPGYLGQHYSIGFYGSFSAALGGPTPSNRGWDRYDLSQEEMEEFFIPGALPNTGLNKLFGIQAAVVTPSNLELVMSYERFNTAMLFHTTTTESSGFNSFELEHTTLTKLKVNAFHLQVRGYSKKKGAVAPMGLYYGLGGRVCWVGNELIEHRTNSEVFNGENSSILPDKPVRMSFLTFEMGRNTILTDRLMLNIGVASALPIVLPPLDGSLSYLETVSDYMNRVRDFDRSELRSERTDDFEVEARLRLWRYSLLQFKFGLSYFLR